AHCSLPKFHGVRLQLLFADTQPRSDLVHALSLPLVRVQPSCPQLPPLVHDDRTVVVSAELGEATGTNRIIARYPKCTCCRIHLRRFIPDPRLPLALATKEL